MLFGPGHMGAAPAEAAETAATAGETTARPMPYGMQKFLAKKGITSYDQLNELMKYAPRFRFRRPH